MIEFASCRNDSGTDHSTRRKICRQNLPQFAFFKALGRNLFKCDKINYSFSSVITIAHTKLKTCLALRSHLNFRFFMANCICLQGFPQFQNYRVISYLGSGATSQVFCAVHTLSQKKVAIKRFRKQDMGPDQLDKVRREIEIMQMLDCPFCIDIHETLEDDSYLDIVMEYADNGSLLSHVVSYGSFREEEAANIICEVMFALYFLHKEGILHRDIKLENLMLDKYNNVRLIDFGMSKVTESSQALLHTACGTPDYVAPEVILREPYSDKADIWSLGVLLYAMVTGKHPFQDDNIQQVFKKIVTEDVQFPEYLSDDCVEIIKLCLQRDQHKRPSLRELVSLPFIANAGNYDAMRHLIYRCESEWQECVQAPAIQKTLELVTIPTDVLEIMIQENALNCVMGVYKGFKDEFSTEFLYKGLGCVTINRPVQPERSIKALRQTFCRPAVKIRRSPFNIYDRIKLSPSNDYAVVARSAGNEPETTQKPRQYKAFNPLFNPRIPKRNGMFRKTVAPQILKTPKAITC